MDQEKIDSLILSYLKGETTEEQDRTLSEYLEESAEHLDHFVDLRAISRFLETSRSEEPAPARKAAIRRRTLLRFAIPSVAAVLLLLLGFGFFQIRDRMDRVVYDNSGAKALQVQLPDRSRVWLSEGSILSYGRRSFRRKRDVRLTGQAEFDVSKNAKSPFRVLTPNLEVTVHGTVFQVRDFPSEAYSATTLAEGAVSLRLPSGHGQVNLSVGQKAVYRSKTRELTIEKVPVDKILFRRNGLISIENATIHQIVGQIQSDFGVRLSMISAGTGEELRYTFSYPENASIEAVLDMLEVLTGYRFKAELTSNKINK